MTPGGTPVMAETNLRCAIVARENGYLPAGTAASAPVFVLIEVPLPWPADVADHPFLSEVVALTAQHRGRVQALVPDLETPQGQTRVVVYRRPEGPFLRYARDEHLVPTDQVAATVAAVLATPVPDPPARPEDEPIDVLVCTHGSRDVCCGGEGMRAYAQVAVLQLPGVRVWRTSHTGGHRFAPTAVLFPDGRAWASVDPGLIAGVVGRHIDPEVAAAHDRGCAAFDDPFAQAADTAVLAKEGWAWLERARSVESTLLAEDRRIVTVTGTDPTGATAPLAYRAEVVVRRVLPVPDCGRPLEEARKTSLELEVVDLAKIDDP